MIVPMTVSSFVTESMILR